MVDGGACFDGLAVEWDGGAGTRFFAALRMTAGWGCHPEAAAGGRRISSRTAEQRTGGGILRGACPERSRDAQNEGGLGFSQQFVSREEAFAVERQIKGWTRTKRDADSR